MKLTALQPPYFAGEEPDRAIVSFLTGHLSSLTADELMLFPEYANAGGLTDRKKLLAAAARAPELLDAASAAAKRASGYVALNVLERREGVLKNSTYLFGKNGQKIFCYDKEHLPPAEIALGITPGDGSARCHCVTEADGLRFGFLTCYDVYFNEQIEYLAAEKPDLLLIPGYQRGERTDIIEAQAKLTAFRCNAFLVRSSYSMNDDGHGGNTMIVGPDGRILENLGSRTGACSHTVDPREKYTRSAGFGGQAVRNDDFINDGLRPDSFRR